MQLLDTARRGIGLYTLAEAAAYAKIPLNTLAYWHYGRGNTLPLRPTLIEKDEGRFVTFQEFVEAIAIRSFRVNYGISLPKIREAVSEAKSRYSLDYPFSDKRHRTYAIGKDLHIILEGEDAPIQLTGAHKRQISMRPCLEQFMRDLEFDTNNLAFRYIAYRYAHDSGLISITMTPNICLGAPLVGKTGYTAETLWRAAVAEGSENTAAELYGVREPEVMAACRYCEDIQIVKKVA